MGVRAVLAALVVMVCGVGVAQADVPAVVPIEGRLVVGGWRLSFILEGSSDNAVPVPEAFGGLSPLMSPLGDEMIAARSYGGDLYHYFMDVWKIGTDGSGEVDLSAAAGLGGVNCAAVWSPDGSRILFWHCDRVDGVLPCDTGFRQWVMNADGSDAHPLFPVDGPPWIVTPGAAWAPDGYRFLVFQWGDSQAYTINEDGTDPELLPSVTLDCGASWSRDGSKIAYGDTVEDVVGGAPGWWKRLLVANADGSNPQVLAQHFFSRAALEDDMTRLGKDPADVEGWLWRLGPNFLAWSPIGDRIAFSSAWDFDPETETSNIVDDSQVWLYDFSTGEAFRIGLPDGSDYAGGCLGLDWNGLNTYSDNTEYTVDNTTVGFENVTSNGLTNILVDRQAPTLPPGSVPAGFVYSIKTTAGIDGLITVEMTYLDEDIPSGAAEEELSIYHYDTEAGTWEDITVSRDLVNNIITGVTDSLSPFSLLGGRPRIQRFSDVPATGYGASGLDPYWAFWEIDACAENGVVEGYGDGTYEPTWQVTRAQMAVFIARASVVPEGDAGLDSWEAPATPTFSDVGTSYWCYKHVEYLKNQSVVEGYPDGSYRPTSTVTRDQMAVYVSRAIADPRGEAGLADYTPPEEPTFPDVPTDHWAYKQIEYAHAHDVVFGYDDGRYWPSVAVTRSQMAVYVARAFGLM